MKSAFKGIWGGSSHSDSLVGGGGITVKQEAVCYTMYASPHHSSTRRSGFNHASSGEKGQKMKNTKKGRIHWTGMGIMQNVQYVDLLFTG